MAIEFNRDGPWELPEGWVWARAGDVLPLEYGKGLPERLRDGSGEVPVYGSSGIVGTHTAALIDEPCLIIARKGTVGAIFEEIRPSWPIDTVYFARDSAALNRRYGYWFFSFCRLDRLDQSTAVPSLSRDNYNDFPIPIAPAAEQRRIVARIDELFTEISDGEASLTRARDDLDTWRRALLKAAVTGELTREWREHNHPNETGLEVLARVAQARIGYKTTKTRARTLIVEELDEDALPEIPETWTWSHLGEIGDVVGGATVDKKRRPSDPVTVPYLRVANVQRGHLDLSEIKTISVERNAATSLRLEKGDVLLNEGGDRDKIGRGWIWNGEIDN
jgi:type I restriction enzyme S subunit